MASCQFLKHFSNQSVFANVWPGSVQALSQEGCRHSLPPSFAAGYWSHVYWLSVIFSVPPTHLIPPPFPSPPVPALWLQIPFLHPCHPSFTCYLVLYLPLLSISSHLSKGFITFALTPWRSELLVSNLFHSATSRRSRRPRGVGGQDGHATTARRHTGKAKDGEEEAVRLGITWVKRRLWGVVKTACEHATRDVSVYSCPGMIVPVVRL